MWGYEVWEEVAKVLVGVILGGILVSLFAPNKAPRKQSTSKIITSKSSYPRSIIKGGYSYVLYEREYVSPAEAVTKSKAFYHMVNKRRSVRFFSDRTVPIEVIQNVILSAGTSPSGAHQQPWTFVVVKDPELKHTIRMAAEEEEKLNYAGRMNEKWQRSLDKIGTDADKSYIDVVPYLIIVFKQTHSYDPETNEKQPHYYFERSVGIACGILITAIHQAGLCTLTHTPTPMGFLTKILNRPENEKPYLVLPVGYAAEDCYVPDLQRKALSEIMTLH